MPVLVRFEFLCISLLAAGCAAPPGADPVPPDAVNINQRPSGSITVPSVCERPAVDARVTEGGVDSFAVLWVADHYQVVYVDLAGHSLVSLHLDANGAPIGNPVQIEQTPNAAALPNLLATETGFALAWQETTGAADGELQRSLVRVRALGLSGEPLGVSQTIASGRPRQMRPVLSSSPFGVTIGWMDQSATDVEGLTTVGDSVTSIALLDASLALRTDTPLQRIVPAARVGYPWLAGDDTRVLVMWSQDAGERADAYVSPLAETLDVTYPTSVRDEGAINSALLGRLALTDFGYIATWEDHRSGEAEIYMALLDLDGVSRAFGLVEEPNTGNANWPHMAWNGSAGGVVYYQYRGGRPQIFMTFIDSSGARVAGAADAQVSNTTAQAKYPDVVWTGREFGVLWVDTRDGQWELYFNAARCDRPAPI